MVEKMAQITLPDKNIVFSMMLDDANRNEDYLLRHFLDNCMYEPEVMECIKRAVRPGDYCVDVGANVGFFTLVMSKLVGDSGHVMAFEPGTNNLPRLKQNLALNKVTNVTLIERPLWSNVEMVKFWLDADSSGSNALWDPGLWCENAKSRANPESYEIEATTLDTEIKQHVRLIKIDTEGAEQRILEGAKALLDLYGIEFIIAEFNPVGLSHLQCTGQSLREYMHQFGYDTFLLHCEGRLPALVPVNSVIRHDRDIVVLNALFSSVSAVGKVWPHVPF